MKAISVNITLVVFRIKSDTLCVYAPDGKLPTETISETGTLDKQVEEIFFKHLGFSLDNHYVEQLFTFSQKADEITIAYYVLLSNNSQQMTFGDCKKITGAKNLNSQIISYAVQRLRWKIEYTNVIYSLLPKTFTLSELQKSYEIILGKKLDKRNFRKKILSLHFLKSTGKKRIDNARPAEMYTFTKRSPMIVKIFS